MLTRARPARAPYSGRPQGLAGRSLGVPWSGSGAAATAGCQPECSIFKFTGSFLCDGPSESGPPGARARGRQRPGFKADCHTSSPPSAS